MFDAVTHASAHRKGRLGAGALLSLGLHAGLLLVALLLPASPPPPPPEPPLVFLTPVPRGPAAAAPPGPAAPRAQAPRPAARPQARRARTLTPPRQVPPAPAELPPLPTLPPLPLETSEGQEEGDGAQAPRGGEPPGAVGCVGPACTGSGPGGGGGGEVAFGAGMTRPVRVSGEDPRYTREARAAGVEGVLVVRCTITPEGTLEDCRVLKGLPHMDAEVLRALSTHRYTPVTFQGRAVRVGYVFNIRLRMPD